jgi:hypothetical protein
MSESISGILSLSFIQPAGADPCQTIHGAAAPALASSTPKACAGAASVGMARRCASCPSLHQQMLKLKMPSLPTRLLGLGKIEHGPSMTRSPFPLEVLQPLKQGTRLPR